MHCEKADGNVPNITFPCGNIPIFYNSRKHCFRKYADKQVFEKCSKYDCAVINHTKLSAGDCTTW